MMHMYYTVYIYIYLYINKLLVRTLFDVLFQRFLPAPLACHFCNQVFDALRRRTLYRRGGEVFMA